MAPPMARNGRCSGRPRDQAPRCEGWANQQVWMGHAAVTSADTHRSTETFARGGVGQAGVETAPFQAWIDNWQMRGLDAFDDATSRRSNSPRHPPISATRCASMPTGRWCCRATAASAANRIAARPRIITASPSSRRPAASPSTTSRSTSPALPGWTANGAASRSPPTRPDGTGSRCISNSGEKLMLYRLRQKDGRNNLFGNCIAPDGRSVEIASADNSMTPTASPTSRDARCRPRGAWLFPRTA